jgi:pyrroloquinoline quinone biosynthesis protein B
MSEIPHPSVRESMDRLSVLSEKDRRKVHFIHFNHTNPLLKADSPELEIVQEMGFQVAQNGSVHPI